MPREKSLSDPQISPALSVRTSARRRLLVLDDDTAVLQTIRLLARRLGADVCTCSTLGEFEAALSSFQPDVLLVDLMMPEVDGIDVVFRVGARSGAAIYIMTGADKRTFEASCEVLRLSSVAIAGYLHKPFRAPDLARILEGSQPADPRRPSGMLARSRRGLLSSDDFAKAVRTGRIEPYFQPIFHADGKTLKGFEALARIESEQQSFFAPEYLDQLVQDNDLAATLTDLIIERALDFLASLQDRCELTISINIFGIHAVAEGFREQLVRQCARRSIAPERVILELSEATIFDLGDEQLRKITQLRLAGFGLSIDDFGTGNSSLGRLASLPFSELKIDKTFCLAMPQSDSATAVVEACLGLARRLGMAVIAEGVETADVAAILARMGCDALQGHHFGQAMPGDMAIRWLKEGSPRAAA